LIQAASQQTFSASIAVTSGWRELVFCRPDQPDFLGAAACLMARPDLVLTDPAALNDQAKKAHFD